MPSKNPTIKKAFKDGVITKGQYDKLSDGLLLGIINKKKGSKQPKKTMTAKRKGTKEVRHKTGKEAHKRGRPKGGSMVKVEK
tara:strand:+ start:84 stop:329 length:246 start_codon:yes stop_codon:yes gene_type:complete